MPIFKGPKEMAVADTLIKNRNAESERQKRAELERLKERDPNRLLSSMLAERYLIVEKIGEGGMGTVYLAEDTKIGGKVAVKVLPKYLSRAPQVVERFVQEARVSPMIEHENIVKVTDLGTTMEGVPFFVMEYLRGRDLFQEMAGGTMGWNRRTSDIILQVCRALSAAHAKIIIHRDMKPENIFLVEHSDGRPFVKLVDFGIAKMLEQAHVFEATPEGTITIGTSARKTQAGVVMGTPSYMAPEQARGGDIDHRVDIYAVGTILYEMVCGGVPFDPEGFEGVQRAHMILEMQKQAEPLPPSRKRPDLKFNPELEALIMKTLKKNPDERFPTMAELEKAIAAIEAPEPQAVRARNGAGVRPGSRSVIGYGELKKAEAARRRRRRVRVAAAVVAMALAGAAAYRVYPDVIDRIFHSEESQKK